MTNHVTEEYVHREMDDLAGRPGAADETPTNETAEYQTKKRKNEQNGETNKKAKVQENRAIYVSNLPLDAGEEEIAEVFRRYGIIDQGTDGKPRIKMYTDENGMFNGDALIVYFKKDSIPIAIRIMDDYWFRLDDQSKGKISVKEADFSYKRHKDGDKIASSMTRKDKKASERNRADLNRKLAEWSDNEDEVAEAFAPKRNKWAKTVIMKHAFTLAELEEDAGAYLEIKEDIRDEAGLTGPVTNVTLFDKEKDGIITVRFKEFEDAEKFCKASNGRKFAGRALECWLAEDRPKFQKSKAGNASPSDSDKE